VGGEEKELTTKAQREEKERTQRRKRFMGRKKKLPTDANWILSFLFFSSL
jgi:hypothetical protein